MSPMPVMPSSVSTVTTPYSNEGWTPSAVRVRWLGIETGIAVTFVICIGLSWPGGRPACGPIAPGCYEVRTTTELDDLELKHGRVFGLRPRHVADALLYSRAPGSASGGGE